MNRSVVGCLAAAAVLAAGLLGVAAGCTTPKQRAPVDIGALYYASPAQRPGPQQRWTPGDAQPVTLPASFAGRTDNSNVSPDGRWGSYVDNSSTLRVVDLRTGETKLTVPNAEIYCAQPS